MARRAARMLALVLAVVGLSVAPAGAKTDGSAAPLRSLERGVLDNINNLRVEHGLPRLRLSSGLAAAARQHTTEMADRGYFSHSSANGGSFDHRIARFYPMGQSHYWSVGEHLLVSSPDVDPGGALNMWLNSPEHRKIMLTARWREI